MMHKSILRGMAIALGTLLIGGTAAAQQDWPGKADWDKTVAAAKKEGHVVISGPVGNSWRGVLTSFSKEYGIKVDFTAAHGADFWPRYEQEQKLGKSLWDLRISAPDLNSYALLARGDRIADLRAMLVLPEVTNDKSWYGGYDSIYSDKAKKYFIGFGLIGGPLAWVNRDIIPESELSSMQQLIDPKFKGKVTTLDWRGGSASNNFALLLADPKYGPDYIRTLVMTNGIVVTNNSRQQVDWLVRGNYPIAISVTSNILFNMQDTGLGQNVKPLPGPLKYSSSFGGLIAFQNAPNPNAAKVYANWILTRETQDKIAKAANYNSRRTDVAPGEPQTQVDLKQLGDYVNTQSEDMLPNYEKWRQFSKQLKQQ
jgi:iron(III) transport system substrate-binding protein